MRKNIPLDDKMAGETRDYVFSWAPYLQTDDEIDGEPQTPDVLYGSVEAGSNTVSGAVQTFRLSGGSVGPVAIKLAVSTVAGETLEAVVTLNIL